MKESHIQPQSNVYMQTAAAERHPSPNHQVRFQVGDNVSSLGVYHTPSSPNSGKPDAQSLPPVASGIGICFLRPSSSRKPRERWIEMGQDNEPPGTKCANTTSHVPHDWVILPSSVPTPVLLSPPSRSISESISDELT